MLAATALASSATVDRVVAEVGNQALTASDVAAEYRMELLLEGKSPSWTDPDTNTLNQVRDRLVDRMLLEDEARADGIQVAPADPEVDERLKSLLQKFPSPEAFDASLKRLGLTQDDLRQHFRREERALRVIDERLRPLATVEPSEIEAYYRQTLVPELAKQSSDPPPPLPEVESDIREILTQQKINQALPDWLKSLRASQDIHLYGDATAEDKS